MREFLPRRKRHGFAVCEPYNALAYRTRARTSLRLTQATLFYRSQTPVEQAHIRRGFRFELTKVQVPAIRERVVAMLANVDGQLASTLARELGMAMPEPLPRATGSVTPSDGEPLEAELSLEAMPAVLFDALAIPGGAAQLGTVGQALEFVKDQYRHAKPILALGDGVELLDRAGATQRLPSGEPDPGVIVHRETREALPRFIQAIARHRHHEREQDPPIV